MFSIVDLLNAKQSKVFVNKPLRFRKSWLFKNFDFSNKTGLYRFVFRCVDTSKKN